MTVLQRLQTHRGRRYEIGSFEKNDFADQSCNPNRLAFYDLASKRSAFFPSFFFLTSALDPLACTGEARETPLVSARLSKQEVPSSILSDLNVCSDFPLIHVAIALNTRKLEQGQRCRG